MKSLGKGVVIGGFAFVLAILLIILSFWSIPSSIGEPIKDAPDIEIVDQYGIRTALSEIRGNITVLHFTQIEYPLCLECESSIIGQLRELSNLDLRGIANVSIMTINLRKNVLSETGLVIAERDLGIDVTWRWMEEFEPYDNAYKYVDYWQYRGGLSNPTILLIDEDQQMMAVYHVYVVGQGNIDGIRTADGISSDIARIQKGTWGDVMIGTTGTFDLSLWSMFALGALTSFSPCSLALLITLIFYIGSVSDMKGRGGKNNDRRIVNLEIGLAFTAGMALTFMLIGAFLGYLSELLVFSSLFYLLGGGVLIVLGINAVKPFRRWSGHADDSCDAGCSLPSGGKGSFQGAILKKLSRRSKPMAGLSLGVLFSLGWAPCALSLVFPMLLLMLAQGLPVAEMAVLLMVFGLGHGLVVIPLCVTTGQAQEMIRDRFTSIAMPIKVGFGAAIIVMGFVFIARTWGIVLW